MATVRLLLNRDHPDYEKIASAIQKNLEELETAKIQTETEKAPPGTLGPEWLHVTQFIISHAGQLIDLATAILNMTAGILALRGIKAGKKKTESPIIIVVNNNQINLPASEDKAKRFVKSLRGNDSEATAVGTVRELPGKRQIQKRNPARGKK